MRSHNSGNIQVENLHISALERKNSFLEKDNIFSQKTYATIIRTYWATKYESRCEKRIVGDLTPVCLMHVDISSKKLTFRAPFALTKLNAQNVNFNVSF